MDIAEWLRGLGLEQYEPAFRENQISPDLLPSLTVEDLKDLGVTLVGHRRRLLQAIAALQTKPNEKAAAQQTEPPSAKAQAERRQVTVMFCDLVGSTELASRLDPEDLREVIGRYHARVAETVRRFNGFVAKYMGDGVLIYFGYPQAHEDDPEQAVRAGLALVDAARKLQAPEPLQVRVGVATGLVVVGDLIGEGESRERGIVGETPNLAARLQALADPGTVVISEGTRRQIGSFFDMHDLGPQSLKGYAQEQSSWRVVSENRAIGRFEALRSRATPLVGREEELELLLRRWAQAKSGNGRVVLISAEPGIGKSRLIETLAERIAGEPHIRLRYFCSPHHQDSALHPYISQLERAADFSRDDTDENKLVKLKKLLSHSDATHEAAALIAQLLSIPTDQQERIKEMAPQARRDRTIAALLAQLDGLAAKKPVLLIYEDIHWIDPSSRELLDRTIEQLGHLSVLLLATFRPEFETPWAGQPNVTSLTLNRLDRRDAATLIAEITGSKLLSGEIVREIAERTDGVPLFIEEVTRAAIEVGAGANAALSSLPHPALSVPATLHASLIARLDRLGSAAKDVAQRAAVIGREFGYELLAAIADRSETELGSALERLTGSGLVFARGLPPDSTYVFKHALIQDVAYGTLLRVARQQSHARIAKALQQSSPVAHGQPALLAYHFTEAGLADDAVAHWLKAGQQSLANSAGVEAATQLRKGLEVLASVPDGVSRRKQELDLLFALRPALQAMKGPLDPEVGTIIARARALAKQVDRSEYLPTLALAQWTIHWVRSERSEALSITSELEKQGIAENDLFIQLWSRRARACTLCLGGKFVAARDLLEQCHGLAALTGDMDRSGVSDDPYVAALCNLALAMVFLGHIDQARSTLSKARSETRRLQHGATAGSLIFWESWVATVARSPKMEEYASNVQNVATKRGYAWMLSWAMIFRGMSLIAVRQAQEGRELLITGLNAVQARGVRYFVPTILTWLAEANALLGQTDAGLRCLAEAEQIIESTEERCSEAELHRVRGDLLSLLGNRGAAADASLQKAIAVARDQQGKLFELRASTSLARLWRDHGRIADARDLLTPIYGWFTEGFDLPDLIEAKALLGELEVALGRSPTAAMPATART